MTDSLAPGPRQAYLDAPGRHLGVFLLADEIDLGRPDIRVPGELPRFVGSARSDLVISCY